MNFLRACVLTILCLWAPSAFAATYYVTTSGNDTTGNGSQGNPWRTPQKCVDSMTTAGDVCLVGDGTYTAPASRPTTVIYIHTNTVHGQNGNPITIKSLNYLGAKLTVPSVASTEDRAVLVTRNYWVIEGFDISGGTSTTGNHIGISVQGGTGTVVRRNAIHNIARTVCSTNAFGNAGMLFHGTITNFVVEYNLFYSIGRLRVGESGCAASVTNDANDHGLYVKDSSGLIVQGNVFYDTNRGWPIHFFGGTNTSVTVRNNTFADKTTTSYPPGQIIIQSTWLGASTFTNNIFSNPLTAPFAWFSSSGAGTITINYNLTDSNDANWFNGNVPPQLVGGAVGANSIKNTSPGFTNAAGRDYSLATGSGAIDAGTAITGQSSNGLRDIGAYEWFGCTSGTVAGNVARLQCNMSVNTPLAVGLAAGYSVNNGRTVTGVELVGSSAVDITFDGAVCTDAQSWTASYSKTTGTAKDGANIAGTYQPLNTLGPITLTNQCEAEGGGGGGPAYTFTQTAGAFYEANAPQSSARQLFEAHAGGAIAVRTKFKATGADAPAVTTKLQCAVNGADGDFADVPDAYTAGDCPNVRYVGTVSVTGRDTHTTATTERLTSEFDSLVAGAVVRCLSGCEVPAVTLTEDSETEQVDIIEFDTDATGTYHFRRVLSDDTEMTYTVTPSITITTPAASGGVAYLGEQPVGLTVTPNPTQAPQPSHGSLVAVGMSLW